MSILSDVLTLLPPVRSTATQSMKRNDSIILEAVGEVEKACLVALEIIAQIDILVDFGTKNSRIRTFLEVLTRKLLPAVSCLSVHISGDVRVVASATLRRMIPAALKGLGREDVEMCLCGLLSHVTVLMADHDPIPQYTLRLLCEAIRASQYAARYIASALISGGGLNMFIILLGGTKNIRNGKYKDKDKTEGSLEEDVLSECDPQLPVLLRILYEKGQIEEQEEQQAYLKQKKNPLLPGSPIMKKDCTKITSTMLELGISQSLCAAIQSCMGTLNYSADPTSAATLLVLPVKTELLCSLIELLHRYYITHTTCFIIAHSQCYSEIIFSSLILFCIYYYHLMS